MEKENDVNVDSSPQEVVVPQEDAVSEDAKTPPSEPQRKAEEKTVPYSRFKEVVDENAKLKKQPPKVVNKNLDVDDYIDISASLQGLDSREQAYVAQQHKLTGNPLKDIIKSEDFLLWQSAYRAKVEKERSNIVPSSKQFNADEPISLEQALAEAKTAEEKEKLLTEAGLYTSPRPRSDRVIIGR